MEVFTYSDNKIVKLEQKGEYCGFQTGDLVEGFFFDLKIKKAIIVGFSSDSDVCYVWAVYNPVLYHPKLKMFIAIPFNCYKVQRSLNIVERPDLLDLTKNGLKESLSEFLERTGERLY